LNASGIHLSSGNMPDLSTKPYFSEGERPMLSVVVVVVLGWFWCCFCCKSSPKCFCFCCKSSPKCCSSWSFVLVVEVMEVGLDGDLADRE
jgi:hypothetical protein